MTWQKTYTWMLIHSSIVYDMWWDEGGWGREELLGGRGQVADKIGVDETVEGGDPENSYPPPI